MFDDDDNDDVRRKEPLRPQVRITDLDDGFIRFDRGPSRFVFPTTRVLTPLEQRWFDALMVEARDWPWAPGERPCRS